MKNIFSGRLMALFLLALNPLAWAHGISEEDRQRMLDGSYFQYVGLGASHMLTGYDHLLFLFGVVFFLTTFKDVAKFVTVFTLGHCITLMATDWNGASFARRPPIQQHQQRSRQADRYHSQRHTLVGRTLRELIKNVG